MSVVPSTALHTGYWDIVQTDDLPDLGPGPRARVMAAHELVRKLDAWLRQAGIEEPARAYLRAAALLYHDHHDPAHDLVQEGHDADAALIHAILHRREPDYWNAKYWFRRIGEHAVYRQLAARVPALAGEGPLRAMAHRLTMTGSVDPFALVDEVERVSRGRAGGPESEFLRRLQHAEFETLVLHLLG